MPIEAVFCDSTDGRNPSVYLQMPYYRNGTLREWLARGVDGESEGKMRIGT